MKIVGSNSLNNVITVSVIAQKQAFHDMPLELKQMIFYTD